MINVIHYNQAWLNLTENWIYNQLKYLPSDVHSVVWTDQCLNLEKFSWQSIEQMPKLNRLKFFLLYGWRCMSVRKRVSFLAYLKDKYDAQILHSHFGTNGWSNIKAAKANSLKHVVTFYGYDLSGLIHTNPFWKNRYQELFDSVDKVLCEGPYMAARSVSLGCPPEKVVVHHIGVEVDKIDFQPRLWNTTEPINFLIAASFVEKKGISHALTALGKLKHLNYTITIIGDARKGETHSEKEKIKILEIIKKYDLESRIRMTGFVDQQTFWQEAYKSHVFLAPSVHAENGDNEGGAPIGIIEMMAAGNLVVSSRHCDIPNVIENNVSGLLSDEMDIDGIINNILWLYKNPEQWERIRICARKRIESKFNVSEQAKVQELIYKSILA